MVICHQKRCIFIHIPKTAGTSIEHFIKDNNKNHLELIGVLNNRSMQHYTAQELKNIYPVVYNNYYKFSIVRNPYERLLSEYYWTPVPDLGFKSGRNKADFLYHVIDIVKNNKYNENIYYDHLAPQYSFICNNKKQLVIDQLFKYEDLEWVSSYLKKKLEIESDFPYLNKSKSLIKKDDWTPNQKEKIYKLYKNDFLLFGYKK
jgi:hypothetical protein